MNQERIEKVLTNMLTTGGDFAEVFIEEIDHFTKCSHPTICPFVGFEIEPMPIIYMKKMSYSVY